MAAKVGRGADGERAQTLALSQLFGSRCDRVEGVTYHSKKVAARASDDEAVALAVEQLDAKLSFKRFHLMTDRSLGDTQLLRSAREALMPGRCINDLSALSDGGKRRTIATHE